MKRSDKSVASRIATRIEAFNDWLYARLKKSQILLDNLKSKN